MARARTTSSNDQDVHDHASAVAAARRAREEQRLALSREERLVHAKLSRRAFLGTTAAGTLAALGGSEPTLVHAQGTFSRRRATADAVIVLWMAGGMAQTETFDPKRYTPYAPGVPLSDVLSTFPTIDTAVDHIKFTKGLEQIGSVIDRGTVIRTFNAAVREGKDIIPTVSVLRRNTSPRRVGDTERGEEIRRTMGLLTQLVAAYRTNRMRQR